MPSPLETIIKDKIRKSGAISIADYMAMCLGHDQHGYYMTRDPFGVKGDFITAPEVSQMFGEMIGLWLADLWIKMGRPSEFILLECGPGRGTLMEDILRTTQTLEGFHQAKRLYLLEMSPVLTALQKKKLEQYDATWIDDLGVLPTRIPVFLVANEFLDALPVHQLIKRGADWFERQVDLKDDAFHYVEKPVQTHLKNCVPKKIREGKADGVFEVSPFLNQYIKSVNILLKKQNGVALFLDYGHFESAIGETVQSMRSHRFESIFDTPGETDITAHVDFENLAMQAWGDEILVQGPVTQKNFLQGLGIDVRAERLIAGANDSQKQALRSGLHRLIDTNQMGNLFKVLALSNDPNLKIEGFDESLFA